MPQRSIRLIDAIGRKGSCEQPRKPKLYTMTFKEITADLLKTKAEPVETLSVPLQVVPKREAPAVKLVMLDFHCEPAAVESCNKPKPAFLECHAA